MTNSRYGSPHRGTKPAVEVIETIDSPTTARRAPRPRFPLRKATVAVTLASTIAAATLFGYAFNARTSHASQFSGEGSAAAVPAAAAQAAQEGFADRSESVSRNAVREGLNEAVAEQSLKSRDQDLNEAANEATQAVAEETSAERIALMDADLKLVEAQSAKLKKEAEEAAARLAEARKLAEASKIAKSGSAPVSQMSKDDIQRLSSSGGSMPVKENYRVGASFGQTGVWARYHTGQDFPAPVGTPVYAAASGVVLSPTDAGWAGTNVVIQHDTGATLYAHLSSRAVSTGDAVKPGQLIGYVGTTGRSFGAHLHFEYYENGTTPGDVYSASNPMDFLRSKGVGN